MTIFVRLLDAPVPEKARILAEAIGRRREPDRDTDGASRRTFILDSDEFYSMPGSPFAYWVSDGIRKSFSKHPRLASGGRVAQRTNSVDDNFRFARLHWEIGSDGSGLMWFPWYKGGSYSPYYYDPDTVICWDQSRGTYPGFIGTPSRPLERPASADLFFRPALTWPLRTNGLSFRVLPRGGIFGAKGSAMCLEGDSPEDLFVLLAIVNSSAFRYLVSVQTARTELAQSYEVGLIQQTPVPVAPQGTATRLSTLARRAWSLARALDTVNETSRAFVLPATLISRSLPFDRERIQSELLSIQAEIDHQVLALYGFGPAEQGEIAAFGVGAMTNGGSADAVEEDGDDDRRDNAQNSTSALLSWLVGVVFGRFDARLATGERILPPEPEPFDPLLTASPGMWRDGDPQLVRSPDILVDDEGHQHDVAALVAGAADGVGVTAPETSQLRRWLARDFFTLHIRAYSRSRRKAPIYWQLATRSASYSVWVYIHAFSSDTMFRIQDDYIVPKLRLEEQRLGRLRAEAGEGASAAQRRAIAEREAFVDELRALLAEVRRVAPLWSPSLDDGVIINFALLWRLVPHHKQWQRELKATWDALCDGKYDWAHLAMRFWPDRVVPKCVVDRSVAVAHGLENVFWEQDRDGKWSQRKEPIHDVDDLVRERTSNAVRAALHDLLNAPAGVSRGTVGRRATGRTRGGR
ncbi:type II restriction endonuclease subunit M [Actinoplanes subtropicus]|uniref:type II restriction endonuclease subunit M n=1 Tax=Actinoplanes subtropicus TaxID=543632 RepID=UPI000A4929D4|nr:type II restriction endonuclease subunit M [Actinoplanes subtropicus]